MKEKKQFNIPKNYQTSFEFIPGINGIQHLFFVPSVIAGFVLFKHTNFDMDNKILITALLVALPYTLCAVKGARENIPLYKQIFWKFKYMQRQKKFYYKKEGLNNVQSIQQETNGSNKDQATVESRGSRKEKHSRNDSHKGHKKWSVNHS